MGQLVTFRCPACRNYWVLGEDGLEPIFVYRAVPEGAEESPSAGNPPEGRDELMLPFWVAEIDGTDLRKRVDQALLDLKDTTRTILTTELVPDEPERLAAAGALRDELPDRGLERARFLGEASGARALPSSSEIGYLMNRLGTAQNPRVYVPAFRSPNTYAYLKVGRLLTRLQPSFGIVRSDGGERPVLCALRVEEAITLIDFIFFATLPDSIQSNGAFLDKIHLAPATPPRLIEFPFRSRGASLVSIIGGFWISGRLVEPAGALVE